jgi:hypothetical protein
VILLYCFGVCQKFAEGQVIGVTGVLVLAGTPPILSDYNTCILRNLEGTRPGDGPFKPSLFTYRSKVEQGKALGVQVLPN